MTNQINTERVHHDIFLDCIDAAKLRTVVKGKTMPPIEFSDRKTRKADRKMSTSYYVEQLVKESVKDVKPDAESIAWMMEKKRIAVERRKRQDEMVREGANRKPKSEWKKPGRVAGKAYPKYAEAMKRVAAKKRSAAAARKRKSSK